ncbi:hypothetical protein [Marinomonas transparens]|uniref:Uncharacterized protein n=1 Tax=Marinomonas transparens TaxID=2795388 RepID=A0A934JLB4_9GAMM|nr:hypothetical protein [Marinomonas transparens]MBJ7537916.1 hypothetical protein [Marinomonas transparens]
MGIVVTVFMILILLLSVPNPLLQRLQKYQGEIALWAFLAGLWNVAWYGLQHMGEFWGNAALISGLLMLFHSLPLLNPTSWPERLKLPMLKIQQARLRFPHLLNASGIAALAACACLYAYTLIMLNLNG